jgi:hypothetical protein
MNENLYDLLSDVVIPDFSIIDDGDKKIVDLGECGKLETYPLFPGIILAFIDIDLENYDEVFIEEEVSSRFLEINHCLNGRYAYTVGDDEVIYYPVRGCAVDQNLESYLWTCTPHKYPNEYTGINAARFSYWGDGNFRSYYVSRADRNYVRCQKEEAEN